MPFVIPTTTEADRTPQAMYRMKFIDYEEVEGKDYNDPNKTKPRIKWVWLIEAVVSGDDAAEEFIGREHWEWTNVTMGARAPMRWAIDALLGRSFDSIADEGMTLDDLLLKRAIVTIGPVENPRTGQMTIKASAYAPWKGRNARVVEEKPDDEGENDFPF